MEIHGLWLTSGWLFVWARQEKERRTPPPVKGVPQHSRAMAPVYLRAHVVKGAQEGLCTLHLPTTRGGESVGLQPWRVPGLLLTPEEAAGWLLTTNPPDTWGDELLVLRQAARLVLELLLRQRYVPIVSPPWSSDDHTWATWRLLWTDTSDRSRLHALAAALPLAGRCLAPTAKGAAFQPADGVYLLTDFTQDIFHGLLRLWLADHAAAPRSRQGRNPISTWLAGLRTPPRTLKLDAGEAAQLAATVSQWNRPLLEPPPPAFRTCFRLQPPPLPEPPAAEVATTAEPANIDTPAAPWQLEVLLQATNESSLLVSAGDLWQNGPEAALIRQRLGQPDAKLDFDLDLAARIYPPLGATKRDRNARLPLALDEAYRFLTEAAPNLQEAGFTVLLPAWWGRMQTAIRLRGEARASRKASAGGVGLRELVDIDWEAALGDQPLPPEDLTRLAALKVPLVRLKGRWVQVNPDAVKGALKRLQTPPLSLGATLRLAAAPPEETPGLQVEPLSAAEGWLMDLLGQLRGDRTLQELATPANLLTELRPYQGRGFSWLTFLTDHHLGACLADDMGLGKSIQLIALLLHRRAHRTGPHAPTLLVCPTSVVGNWQRELQRFAPDLRVLVQHGAGRSQGPDLAAAVAEADVVLSTYSLAARDADELAAITWDGLVLDEAQNIKNHDTQQSRALRRIPASYRVALTGTPVENRLGELWSIMEFLNPGYLGSEADFHARFTVPIERQQETEAADHLRRLIQPFVLRRLKSDPRIVPDLPPKTEQTVFVTLSPEQATLYEAVMQDTLIQIDEASGMQRRGLVLAALSKLKQICDHPALFLHDGSPLADRSGKLNRLEEMLDEVLAEGERALVFTQFAEMAVRLQAHLAQRLGCETICLHGGVAAGARTELVRRFQEEPAGPPIFILSLKAGGVGLNLTRATHVFHFDRWWNPAVENQATDRAYRLGQQAQVLVHRLVCAGTLEEKIDQLLASKRLLAERIVRTDDAWVTELSTAELRQLFALEG